MGPQVSHLQNLFWHSQTSGLMHEMITNQTENIWQQCFPFGCTFHWLPQQPCLPVLTEENVPKWWNKSLFGCEIPHIVSASPQIRSAAPVSHRSSGFSLLITSQIRARTFSIGLLKLRKIPAARMLPVESQGHLFPPWNRLDKVRAVIFNWFHSHFTHEGKCWWNQLVTRRKTGAMLAGRVNILCKGMWNEVISAAWEEVANVNAERWVIPGITVATSD